MSVIVLDDIFSSILTLAVIVIVVRRDFVLKLVIKNQCKSLGCHESMRDSVELLQLTRI